MAINSWGYDGTVDEVDFGRIMALSASSEYGVDDPNSFKASTVAGQVLMTQLTGGWAWTSGLVDNMTTMETVQYDPVASGTRWDLVVLRRDWTPPGGTTTLAVVKGGASKALPGRSNVRGVLQDQPLWLVRIDAGKSIPSEYVDLRIFARNGGCTANDDLVRSYVSFTGTMIEIKDALWIYRVGANGSNEWKSLVDASDTGWVHSAGPAGFASGWGAAADYIRYRAKNGVTEFIISATRTGPEIPVGVSGDIQNVKLANAPSPARPRTFWHPLSSGPVGRGGSGSLDTTGEVSLNAVTGTVPIKKGHRIQLAGTFINS